MQLISYLKGLWVQDFISWGLIEEMLFRLLQAFDGFPTATGSCRYFSVASSSVLIGFCIAAMTAAMGSATMMKIILDGYVPRCV